MDQSLTIVLPIHNGERQLRSSIQDLFDVSRSLACPLKIVVVDDGSTDDTYETACELSRRYPQVVVFRQSIRQGQNAALELVCNRMVVESVLVHDGVSVIDAAQIRTLLQSENRPEESALTGSSVTQSHGSRRFAAVRVLHDRMEQVHRATVSFRWAKLEKPLIPRRRQATPVVQTAETEPMVGIPISLVNLPVGLPTGMTPLS